MKLTYAFAISLAVLFSGTIAAQDNAIVTKKKIEIEEGDDPSVTITTTKDGKTTIEELHGEEAKRYLAEREKEEAEKERDHARKRVVEIRLDEDDLEDMKEGLREMRVDIEREMDDLSRELKEIDMDSIMQSIGVEVERAKEEVRYHLNIDDDNERSVIIIKSKGSDEDEDIDVEVEVNRADGDKEKKVKVTRTRMVVEDHEEENATSSDLKDLKVYPTPSEGDINVSYELEKPGTVQIKIRDMQGAVQREMKVKGDGKKSLKMNLDDLPAGAYIIEVKEGKAVHSKKLILE